MKKLMASTVLALMAGGVSAAPDMPDEYGYLGLHGSGHFFDITGRVPNPDIDNALLPGIQFGYRFNQRWSVQGWYEMGEFDFEDSDAGGDLVQSLLSGRYHYHDSNLLGFEPYAGLALGEKEFQPDRGDDRYQTVGGPEFGLQKMITDNVALDLGTRATYSFDHERWDGQVYAGINVLLGRPGGGNDGAAAPQDDMPVPVMALKDGDDDGVPDTSDECPRTPAGTAVDASGCAATSDADNDGVVDARDQCPGTPANAKVDDKGCHLVLEEDVRETLYVQFETGKAEVKESSYADIEEIADLMEQYPQSTLVLEGHTDSAGPAALNERLSRERADAVKRVLEERFGIVGERVEAVGKGESQPIADNDTAEGRARNRRVETVLKASREVKQYQ